MNGLIGLILLVVSIPMTVLYDGWGLAVLFLGAYVMFTPKNLLHFQNMDGGLCVHRPRWTKWEDEDGTGTTNWGISVGPVSYEGRRCEVCRMLQHRNMRQN